MRRRRCSSVFFGYCCGLGLACFLWTLRDAAGTAFGTLATGPSSLAMPARVSRRSAIQKGRAALSAVEGLEAVHASLGRVTSFPTSFEDSMSVMMAFADQGQNINGILFQASLPAYILFLYFLSYRKNNTPPLVQYGFAFLLLFVGATIPSGILTKSNFGLILADCDWVHGAAESLLACTNIMLVLGFRAALAGDREMVDSFAIRAASGVWAAAAVATLAAGIPFFGAGAHTLFLSGFGALPSGMVPVTEPVNALSIPNWMVHFSTLFEFLIAMSLAWRYAEASGNPKWKGLTWGMLPSHMSSVAALTFHVFYNGVPWILTAQAAFTFLGNATLAVAAFRIAASNGWTISELNPIPAITRALGGGAETKEENDSDDAAFDVARLKSTTSQLTPGPLLFAEVLLLTVAASFLTKYGELLLAPGLFQSSGDAASIAAAAIIATPPLLVLGTLLAQSEDIRQGRLPAFAGSTGTKES